MGIHLTMEQIVHLLPVLVPVVLLQAALVIVSLISILRKEAAVEQKILWILVVLFISVAGPVMYFAFGAKKLDEDAIQPEGVSLWTPLQRLD